MTNFTDEIILNTWALNFGCDCPAVKKFKQMIQKLLGDDTDGAPVLRPTMN